MIKSPLLVYSCHNRCSGFSNTGKYWWWKILVVENTNATFLLEEEASDHPYFLFI